MAWLAAIYERRPLHVAFAIAIVSLGGLLALLSRASERERVLVGDIERAQLIARFDAMRRAAPSDGCVRPALREPAGGDASSALRGATSATSATSTSATSATSATGTEGRCLERLRELSEELRPACAKRPCPFAPLASLAPRPDVVIACAPLYQVIDVVAHASAACSPYRSPTWDAYRDDFLLWPWHSAHAVRLQVAPLVVQGELAAAARHVTDAMRFADDTGRRANLVGAMMSVAHHTWLADTLTEILVDPRLTPDQARAIAHDLDVLRASVPSFASVVREEALSVAAMRPTVAFITDDIDQDRALTLLSIERWLATYDRACANATLRDCIERLEAQGPHSTGYDDYKPLVASSLDDAIVRETIVASLAAAPRGFMPHYARDHARREHTYLALRLQAELRTLPAEDCRDPARRRAHLAPLLRDDVTIADDGTLIPPAWQQRYRPPMKPARRLGSAACPRGRASRAVAPRGAAASPRCRTTGSGWRCRCGSPAPAPRDDRASRP